MSIYCAAALAPPLPHKTLPRFSPIYSSNSSSPHQNPQAQLGKPTFQTFENSAFNIPNSFNLSTIPTTHKTTISSSTNNNSKAQSFLTEDDFPIVSPNDRKSKSKSPQGHAPQSNTSKSKPSKAANPKVVAPKATASKLFGSKIIGFNSVASKTVASLDAPPMAIHKPDGTVSTFRAIGCKNRAKLRNSVGIELSHHSSKEAVCQLKLKLFEALSTQRNLLKESAGVRFFQLPEWAHPVAVKELVACLQAFCSVDVDVKAMEIIEGIFKDVHIISVAEFMGFSAYTQALFNVYFSHFKTTATPMAEIDTFHKIQTPTADKLLHIVVTYMADLSWYDDVPNAFNFQLCLERNTRFEGTVSSLLTKWTAKDKAETAHANCLEAKAVADRKAAERRAEEKANFAHLAKEDAELCRIVREKMRQSNPKYNTREAAYIWKTLGKRVSV